MRNKFSLLILLMILGLPFSVSGQKKVVKKTSAAKKAAQCKSNEIFFQCPKGSVVFATDESNGLLILKNRQNKDDIFGLFIIAPNNSFDGQQLIKDVSKTALQKLFPKESQNYKSSSVENFPSQNAESQHKVSVETNLWFNERHVVIVKHQHIVHNGKPFLAGYIFEMDRGKEAKEAFENGHLSERPVACQSLIKMISSITGEKVAEDACSFEIRQELN